MSGLKPIEDVTLSAIDLVKYAGASGDFNEIHTVPSAAKAQGFKDTIAHGMLLKGLAAKAVESWFPGDEIRSLTVRFKAITYPGEVLVIKGETEDRTEGGPVRGTIEIEAVDRSVKLAGSFELQ